MMAPCASSLLWISSLTLPSSSLPTRSSMRCLRTSNGAHTRTQTACGTSCSRCVAPQPRITAPLPALGHPHGAVLELRDLADGIERRVGQLVGRGLVIAERDKDRAARRAGIGPRIQRDLAAPRFDGDDFARLRAERREIERMERGYRFGLDGIEHAGAARNGAGMPVLELAAGDEHHRIIPVGLLGGANEVRRDEFCAAGGGGGMRLEHDRLAGISLVLARLANRRGQLHGLAWD